MNYLIAGVVCFIVIISWLFLKTKQMNATDISVYVYIKLMYLYSFLQIQYGKYVKPYMNKMFLVNKVQSNITDNSKLILVKDGTIVKNTPIDLTKLSELFLTENKDGYDFLMFITHVDAENSTNIYSIYNIIPNRVDGRKTDYMFLSMDITIKCENENENKDTIYKYEVFLFKEKEYDFYVSGNVLDSFFWIYYLKHILKCQCPCSSDKITYLLTIMDQNADMIEVNEKNRIVLNQDCYLIE